MATTATDIANNMDAAGTAIGQPGLESEDNINQQGTYVNNVMVIAWQ